jgi:hypothetical protein
MVFSSAIVYIFEIYPVVFGAVTVRFSGHSSLAGTAETARYELCGSLFPAQMHELKDAVM